MTPVIDEFTQVFRAEHRQVRDLLLELLDAIDQRSIARMRDALARTAAVTGPHFRYEEEALYPLLEEIFGRPYVEHLYEEHDQAIAAAKGLVALARADTLDDARAAEAAALVRVILPHVSDCEGLSIMVETMPERDVSSILTARARSRGSNLGLIEWADDMRPRPPVSPATME